MNASQIIELLDSTGHLDYPYGKWQERPPASTGLDVSGVQRAIASYQDFNMAALEPLCQCHHSRPPQANGEIGPATRELFKSRICGCPDYGEKVLPVVGKGSWKECHGIGKYHAATVYIDESGMPGFLKPLFDEIWGRVVRSYEDIGLRWIRTTKRDANIDFRFVNRGAGWIGLAIVGQGQSCGSQIWCKYVSGWHPSNVVPAWTELIQHELGHNCGLQHSRGGKMNASLIIGGDPTWRGDPSESILKRLYGGVPIPAPEPPVPPGPPPGEEDPRTFSGILTNKLKEQVDVIIRPRETPD
jgi:hypothetical protein